MFKDAKINVHHCNDRLLQKYLLQSKKLKLFLDVIDRVNNKT